MINAKYILFTRIPLTKNSQGNFYCDPLWAKDLKIHLNYINDFGLCCPIETSNEVEKLTNISDYNIKNIFELNRDYGLLSVLKNFFPNLLSVMAACKKAEVAHSGGAGWAFPLSFYLFFLKPFFSFKWVIVIESSFWMIDAHEKKTVRKILDYYIHKILLTRSLKSADARIFTQSFYREFFLGKEKKRTLINPASWIDENILLTIDQVKNRSHNKNRGVLKILFPARLEENKGVMIVLKAIEQLQKMNAIVEITIMGAGSLAQQCKSFAANKFGSVEVTFKEPVDYGLEFYAVLGDYDFVLVANLKQEQPRIIFDAFSQGVGVIASDTSGILDITTKENAILFETGNSTSLANVVNNLALKPEESLLYGLSGLQSATGRTHLQMHHDRQLFLEQVLQNS